MRIKICGLKREADVAYVNEIRPDYVGFVFAGEKRKIDSDTAKLLKSQLHKDIPSVGVFVNADMDYIVKLVADKVLDSIQLHGDEDAAYIHDLHRKLGQIALNEARNVTIIKAIRVQTEEQVREAEKLDVDYLLLDAFVKDTYGGCGTTFNHDLIPKLKKPYFLAGGITIENVDAILNALKDKDNLPYCIDVSSSVETNGVKDKGKIYEIVNRVHSLYPCV